MDVLYPAGSQVACPLCTHTTVFQSIQDLYARLTACSSLLKCPACSYSSCNLVELTRHIYNHLPPPPPPLQGVPEPSVPKLEAASYPEEASVQELLEDKKVQEHPQHQDHRLSSPDLDDFLKDFSEIIGQDVSTPTLDKAKVEVKNELTEAAPTHSFEEMTPRSSTENINNNNDNLQDNAAEGPSNSAGKASGNNKQVQCGLCGWNFDDEDFLQLHQVLMHSNKNKKSVASSGAEQPLPVASVLTAKRASQRKNNSSMLPVTEFPCRACGMLFPSCSEFTSHLRSVHGDQRCVCPTCGKLFKVRGSLLVHQRVVHNSPGSGQGESNEGSWPCNTCGKRFTNKYRRDLHEKHHRDVLLVHPLATHEDNNNQPSLAQPPVLQTPPPMEVKPLEPESSISATQHKCTLCHEVYATQAGLILHSVSHIRDKHLVPMSISPVASCSTSQKNPSGLVNNNRPVSPAPFSCNQCGKTFARDVHLLQHMKVHGIDNVGNANSPSSVKSNSPQQNLKAWECDTCHKTFTTKYFLKKHKRLHTGETPYVCTLCGRAFTFQQSYHKHMLYHTDEKPYSCGQCGRAFKELSTLQNHERIHSGERPFQCETCGKSFRQRVSYLVHRRIHTGVMPYSCDTCGKKFRYKVTQRTHKCQPANPEMDSSNGPPPEETSQSPLGQKLLELYI